RRLIVNRKTQTKRQDMRVSVQEGRFTAWILGALLSAAIGTSAISAEEIDNTLGHRSVIPGNAPGARPLPGHRTQLLDDFNRPDGPIGPDWTEEIGVFKVVD